MKINDKRTIDTILAHKNYFDQRLLEIATSADSKIKALEMELKASKKEIYDLNNSLRFLNAQLEGSKKRLKQIGMLLASKDSELEAIISRFKELEKELDEQKKKNEELNKKIEERIKKNDELEEELRRKIRKITSSNSTNSNFGTSHDILSHTVAKAQANTRKKSGLKRGGQTGHLVHRSALSSKPDIIIKRYVDKVPAGAKKVVEDGQEYYATQEIDLVFSSRIVETRYYIQEDGEKLDASLLSKYAINPVSYSNHFKGVMVYLNQRGTIPLERLTEMVFEISEGCISVRPSTIVNWNNELSKKSAETRYWILKDILSEPVVHVDETGEKINGDHGWMHTITNSKGAYFIPTKTRGDIEKGPVAYLENYSGTLEHDHFKTYQRLEKCKHAECNAHIERYMKSGIDIDHSKECEEMIELLHEMLRYKHERIEQGYNEAETDKIELFKERYIEIAQRGIRSYYKEHPNGSSVYTPDYVPTFRRMIKYVDDHLRFLTDFKVPYTNNAAERQCRTVKSKKKISGQFVSEDGFKAYADALTIIQTSRIRKENALEAVERVFF